VIPDAENSDPPTERPEIVTGAVPVDDRVIDWFAVCPTVTLPKLTLFVLTLRVGVLPFALARLAPEKTVSRQIANIRIRLLFQEGLTYDCSLRHKGVPAQLKRIYHLRKPYRTAGFLGLHIP
jgi:hypothetical protein